MSGPVQNLTEGPIGSVLLRFSAPVVLASVLQGLSAAVTAFWSGRFLGEAALSAVVNANLVLLLAYSLVTGVSVAATILIGQAIGAGQIRQAKQVLGTGITVLGTLSTGIAVIGYTGSEIILVWLNTPRESLPGAVPYLRLSFLSLPISIAFAFILGVMRSAGDSKSVLRYLGLNVALAIALTPPLMFGAGTIRGLGVIGYPIASLLAQVIGLALCVFRSYRYRHPLCIYAADAGDLKPQRAVVAVMARKGVPLGAQAIVNSLGVVLMASVINRFGGQTFAAFAAAAQIWNFIVTLPVAFSIAVGAMAAQNIGAGRWSRVSLIARLGMLHSVLVTGLLVAGGVVLGAPLLGVFLPPGSSTLDEAIHLNTIAPWAFVLMAASETLFAIVRSAGRVLVPLALTILTTLVFRFPFAALMGERFGSEAIWWSFPISSTLELLCAWAYYSAGSWRVQTLLAEISQTPRHAP